MKKIRSWLLTVSSALIVSTLTGCNYFPVGLTTIGEIVKAPSNFEGREVKLLGTTSAGMKSPLIDSKSYRLKDASGEIVVWSTGPLPAEGQEVIVRGRIDNALIVGGQSFGLSLKELERDPAVKLPWN